MKIEIVNLGTVKLDDVIFGNFTEAASRNPSLTDALQSALVAYMQAGEQAKSDLASLLALKAQVVALYIAKDYATLDGVIAQAQKSAKDLQVQSLQDEIAARQKELDDLLAQPDAQQAAIKA